MKIDFPPSITSRDCEIISLSPLAVFLMITGPGGTTDPAALPHFLTLLLNFEGNPEDLITGVVSSLSTRLQGEERDSLLKTLNAREILLQAGVLLRGPAFGESGQSFLKHLLILAEQMCRPSNGFLSWFRQTINQKQLPLLNLVDTLLLSPSQKDLDALSRSEADWHFAQTLLSEVIPRMGQLSYFSFRSFSVAPTLPHGQYSMWSSGDSDPNWIESPLRPVLKAIFENLEGYQTAFLGYILYELGVIDAPRRLELPEELGHVALRSPEGVLFVISFSQEKGIRFHFPDEPNSYDFRGSFLRGFFHYTGDFRWLLEEAEITPDDNTFGTSPLRWWDGVNKVKAAQIKSYEAEHGSTLTITEDRIGIFIWNPPQ